MYIYIYIYICIYVYIYIYIYVYQYMLGTFLFFICHDQDMPYSRPLRHSEAARLQHGLFHAPPGSVMSETTREWHVTKKNHSVHTQFMISWSHDMSCLWSFHIISKHLPSSTIIYIPSIHHLYTIYIPSIYHHLPQADSVHLGNITWLSTQRQARATPQSKRSEWTANPGPGPVSTVEFTIELTTFELRIQDWIFKIWI